MAYNLGLNIAVEGKGSLAAFVLDHYQQFGTDRSKNKETMWRASIDAYRGENGDYWKRKATRDTTQADNTDTSFSKNNWRSEVFVMLTKAKVMAGACVLSDTMLQGGKVPFNVMVDKENQDPYAETAAENQTKKLYDQLNYGHADRAFMRNFFSMGLYGGGYLRAPIIRMKKKLRYKQVSFMPPGMEQVMATMPPEQMMRYEPYYIEEQVPCIGYISVWDIFRDLTVEDLQECQGIIDREYITGYELRKLMKKPNYNKEALNRLISDSKSQTMPSDMGTQKPSLEKLTVNRPLCKLRYWGRVPVKYLMSYEKDLYGADTRNTYGFDIREAADGDEEIEGLVTVINGDVVHVSPTSTGKRPYHYAPWEYVLDEAEGRGIADNVRDDQKMINDTVRLMIDNLMLASNVLLAGKSAYFAPGQTKSFYPGKFFEISDTVDDARQAIQQIVIQDCSSGLFNLLQLLQAQADSDANIPKVMEGDAVRKKPQTAFELDQMVQNAGKYIGQVIRNIDEYQIEPVINAMYQFNMLDEENHDAKGDFVINANGFNSFQSRILKTQSIKEVMQMVLSNPELYKEAKLRPHLEEIYKGMDLDPEQLLKSDQDKEQEKAEAIETIQAQIESQYKQQASQMKQTLQQEYQGKMGMMVQAIAQATGMPEQQIGQIADQIMRAQPPPQPGNGQAGPPQPAPEQPQGPPVQ